MTSTLETILKIAAVKLALVEQYVEPVVLTQDQAPQLVSSLNMAFLELELQRTADLARAAEGAASPS
ncbi:hypothetical protein [Paraburkholderia sp. DGU8]|uniref:hypothetical protein n=1 Tax=Paraburkholderia sp. DGU8 TaxID=3161997 RepID=UPI003466DE7C